MFANTGNIFTIVSLVAFFTACSNSSELTNKNYELNIMNGSNVYPSTSDTKYLSTVVISTYNLSSMIFIIFYHIKNNEFKLFTKYSYLNK